MIYTKFIISTAIFSGLFIVVTTMPSIATAKNNATKHVLGNSLVLAQAHEHDDKRDKSKKRKRKGHQDGHGGHKHKTKNNNYAQMITSHADALELTDEQLGKITRLSMKATKDHKEIKQKLLKGMKAFHKASMKPDTDIASLRRLGEEHVAIFNEIVEQHISERQAVHNTLTTDQMNKLNTMNMQHDDDQDSKHDHH